MGLKLTRDYLYKEYIIKRKSCHTIAKKVACDRTTVQKYLRNYNIPIRTLSEAFSGRIVSKVTRRKRSRTMMGTRLQEKSTYWRGEKLINSLGYVKIKNPSGRGRIFEHRLVIEQELNRKLKSSEQAHHINEIKMDNRIENLMLFSGLSSHKRYHKNPDKVKPSEILFDGRK